jgi:hypothetical protein
MKRVPWKITEDKIVRQYAETHSARYIQENFLPHRTLSSVSARRNFVIRYREEAAGIREYAFRVEESRLVYFRVK